MNMNQSSSIQNQPAVYSVMNAQSGSQILQRYTQSSFQIQQRYSITISPARSLILTQQINADFQLSQEAWHHISNQINEMSEANRLK